MTTLIVLICLFRLVVSDLNMLLLHTNDMHARFEQTDRTLGICGDNSSLCYGGFARLHSEVMLKRQEAAASGRPAIFLNAGDTFQGTPYYTLLKWPIVAELIDMLGIDVMCLGNHEFDDGIEGVAPYIKNISVPTVCSNLNISQEPSLDSPNLTPSKVLNVSGVSVGVIGYLTPETMEMSSTGKLQILDEIASVRAEAKRLQSLGVNILIALGHSGYDKDQEIAQQVEEIDVVVGGHSHTFLYSGKPPDIEVSRGPYPTVVTQASGKRVPVVQAYYATKYLGYIELDFDDQGNLTDFRGSPILLSGNLTRDPEILAALEPFKQKVDAEMLSIVGESKVVLSRSTCRVAECNLGNLVTDALVDHVARYLRPDGGWTVAPAAMYQAGGIRATIDTRHNEYQNGSISFGDVMTSFPWGNKIVLLNVTGRHLKEVLEVPFEKHDASLLQVSGLRVVYDLGKVPGERVSSVSILCADCAVPVYQPLQPDLVYTVAVPDYLAHGGDGFTEFKNATIVITLDSVDYVVVSEYIANHSPVHPAVEGRITLFNSTAESSASISYARSSRVFLFIMILLIAINMPSF